MGIATNVVQLMSAVVLLGARAAGQQQAILPSSPPSHPAPSGTLLPGPPAAPAAGAESHPTDLVQDYRNGLVFVEGSQGRGSGFICNLQGHKLLISNAHVLAGIQAPVFKLLDRSPIQVGQASVAVGHDIAVLAVANGGKPFEAMESVDTTAAIGDAVVVLGNSEGAGVIKPLEGKIVGLGPDLVEVDAQFVPGNSGSPIIHKPSGKVIGVATYLMMRRFGDENGKGVKTEVRRFGYRLDSVKKWQPIVWPAFYAQAAEVAKVEGLTGDLVRFLQDLSTGKIHPELHQNPVIKPRLDSWLEVRRRKGVSPHDKEMADENLLSFLKLACQTDVTQARQRLTYDYFIRELDQEENDRRELSAVFTKLVTLLR